MNKQRQPVLGIDVGRVIICAADPSGRNDTSFLSGSDEQALQTPPSPGAFSAIAALYQEFEGRVWLVSKCGPRIQQLTRRWLSESGFHRATGVRPEHVRFCRKRPEKREHCLQIGATHFVDDRLDVISHLAGLVPNLYWFGHQAGDPAAPPYAQRTLDWAATHEAIASSLGWFHVRSAQGHAR